MEKERIKEINKMKTHAGNIEMESRFFKNEGEWHWFLEEATRGRITEDEALEITSVRLTLSDLVIEEIWFEDAEVA